MNHGRNEFKKKSKINMRYQLHNEQHSSKKIQSKSRIGRIRESWEPSFQKEHSFKKNIANFLILRQNILKVEKTRKYFHLLLYYKRKVLPCQHSSGSPQPIFHSFSKGWVQNWTDDRRWLSSYWKRRRMKQDKPSEAPSEKQYPAVSKWREYLGGRENVQAWGEYL